jgi:ERG8-type phosphomevalonate kinase
VTISAPGKLFLAGEYAVLTGGTAVVAAVDRRAVARFVPGGAPSTPLIAEVVKAVKRHCELHDLPLLDGTAEVDSSALNEDRRKLGLGSSAAATVAAVGALLEATGRELREWRPVALALSMRAHRAAQGGRGSGGDVAAAFFGGVIAFCRAGGDTPAVRRLPEILPGELVVFGAGGPISTVDHLQGVERLAARDPEVHARRLREIAEAADAFIAAVERSDAQALIAAVFRSHQALDALGQAADLPIVTPALAAAATAAMELGGAAKPSGAGGGDVGVAFFADPDSAGAFRAHASRLNLPILSIKTGAPGLTQQDERRPERLHVE